MDIVAAEREATDARYLAASIAVELGERGAAVDVLCDEVAHGTRWSVPAAGVLGRRRVSSATSAIVQALERVDAKDGVAVAGLSEALRGTGGALPSDLRDRLVRDAEPWIAQTVERDFPLT